MSATVISSTTKKKLYKIEAGGEESERLLKHNTLHLEAGASRYFVLSRATTAPPGSPADQDAYYVPSGATGAWANFVGYVAIYSLDDAEWTFSLPAEDSVFYVDDEDALVRLGASTIELNAPPVKGMQRFSVTKAITASTTQTQGQQPLTSTYNAVDTVANANDVVTLPTAVVGNRIHIWNRGANTLQVYPASGDKINGGSTNSSTTIAAAAKATFVAIDSDEYLIEGTS